MGWWCRLSGPTFRRDRSGKGHLRWNNSRPSARALASIPVHCASLPITDPALRGRGQEHQEPVAAGTNPRLMILCSVSKGIIPGPIRHKPLSPARPTGGLDEWPSPGNICYLRGKRTRDGVEVVFVQSWNNSLKPSGLQKHAAAGHHIQADAGHDARAWQGHCAPDDIQCGAVAILMRLRSGALRS